MRYDAIIVGARCAGSSLAMLLARRGYAVLVLERARFPSDTVSSHAIWQAGCAALQRFGLLDRVAASGCPPVYRGRIDVGGGMFVASEIPPTEGVKEAYCTRRIVLDEILADAAVEAGAELRTGCRVERLLWDGDRVVGVRGRDQRRRPFSERARIVIGADGRRSSTARQVRARSYRALPARLFWVITYWADLPMEGFEWYPHEGRCLLGFPTNDELTSIAVGGRPEQFREFRADLEGNLYATAKSIAPEFEERMRAGRRAEKVSGVTDLDTYFRQCWGPGWALVGDAGYHRDPVTGQGILDAFHHAEMLAEALDRAFRGVQRLEAALSRYQRERDRQVLPMYCWTCERARLDSSRSAHFIRAMRDDPERARKFFGVAAGSTPVQEVWPEVLDAIAPHSAAAGRVTEPA